MGIWGHLGTSLGHGLGGSILGGFWVNSEVNMVNSGPLSEKPHQNSWNSLHLAVGRALRLKYD